jgi:hypothetical protein
MSRKRSRIPAFLELTDHGRRVFVQSDAYLANPEFRGQVVNRALAELGRWRERFGDLFDLIAQDVAQAIVRQIDTLKKKLGRHWPELPVDVLGWQNIEMNSKRDSDQAVARGR